MNKEIKKYIKYVKKIIPFYHDFNGFYYRESRYCEG